MANTETMGSTVEETVSQPILRRQESKSGVDSRFCCNICLEAVVEPVATMCGHLYCWPCLFRWLEPGMHPEERASLGMLQRPLVNDSNRRFCPVCKAPCSVSALVPIYVRESDKEDDESSIAAPTNIEAHQKDIGSDSAQGIGENLLDGETTDESTTDWGLHHEPSVTGLRQRLRFRSRDSDNSADSVPSRPPAQSPRHLSPSSSATVPPTPQIYRNNNWVAPLTPNGGSLTHGLLLSLQQATAGRTGVPPLHRRDGTHPGDVEAHPGASDYLSRILLMLFCFVLLCLLLL